MFKKKVKPVHPSEDGFPDIDAISINQMGTLPFDSILFNLRGNAQGEHTLGGVQATFYRMGDDRVFIQRATEPERKQVTAKDHSLLLWMGKILTNYNPLAPIGPLGNQPRFRPQGIVWVEQIRADMLRAIVKMLPTKLALPA